MKITILIMPGPESASLPKESSATLRNVFWLQFSIFWEVWSGSSFAVATEQLELSGASLLSLDYRREHKHISSSIVMHLTGHPYH